MKTQLWLFIVSLLLSYPLSATVKLKSFLCDTKEGLESTAIPVRYKEKNYLLTSPWGVLEEEKGICHEFTESNSTKAFTATLTYLDWGFGIALLSHEENLEPIFDFDKETPTAGTTNLRAEGFPKGKMGLEERKTRVVAAKSSRHHFPSLPKAMEVGTDSVDSGFVGAPVYAEKLVGMITSQWVELIPGAKARVNEWKPQQKETSRHLIVLPLSAIGERIKSLKQYSSTFEPAHSKLGDRSTFYVGGVKWKLVCPKEAGKPPKDGIGPIGGADGVGIGGNMKGTETCSLQTEAQKEIFLSTPDFIPAPLLETFEKIHKQGDSSVPFLYARDVGDNFVRLPFLSIPEFLKIISEGEKLPVLLYPTLMGLSHYEAQLASESRKLRHVLTETYSQISHLDDERMEFRKLYALSLLFDSIYWKKYKHNEFMSTELTKGPFATGITYKGQPLLDVLYKFHQDLKTLHAQSGGIN